MGNQNSRSNVQSPTGTSVTSSHGAGHAQPQQQQQQQQQQPPHSHTPSHPHPHSQPAAAPIPHTARRRESIQALSIVKAQAAPPSASLENAESHPTSHRPHSRGRSQTVAGSSNLSTSAAVAIQLRAAHDSYSARPSYTPAMGNEQSSHKAKAARQITPPHLVPLPVSVPAASPAEKAQPQTQQQQHQQYPPLPPPQHAVPSPQTLPVNVPAASTVSRDEPIIDPADASQDYIVPSSHFSRPPRLPLPIEEELYVPGSPIISPQDLDHGEVEGALPRRASIISTNTADDDDLGDEFKGPSSGRPTVQTLIEWEGPGERIYVTGTFAGWNKKYKLHRNGPSKKKDVRSTYVPIAPGTHHLMFIVDNDMRTSDKLPTAVDYTNILVNYLEVSYDDIPAPAPAVAEPVDSTPVQNREAPAGVYPPQVLPPTPALQPVKPPLPEPPKPKAPEPKKRYHQNIPRYLLDLDAHEESSRFARANAMTNNLPTPPTLPGFLGKSILNGTTPMKDDSSVLIHPNHTVLNHLATSSIKDNILATSATTRYKQKFLTTIMYKPKEESPEHVY